MNASYSDLEEELHGLSPRANYSDLHKAKNKSHISNKMELNSCSWQIIFHIWHSEHVKWVPCHSGMARP
jgi:hypothetical protein